MLLHSNQFDMSDSIEFFFKKNSLLLFATLLSEITKLLKKKPEFDDFEAPGSRLLILKWMNWKPTILLISWNN